MSHFTVTLTFDKDIPSSKTTIDKLKKEIYDKIFRVEWLIKMIYFSKSDISCKGDKAFIKFKSVYENSKKSLTPKITTALKGSKWSKLYLDESLKAIKLQVVVKNKPDLNFGKSKKTRRKKKGGGKTKMTTSEFKEFLQGKEREGWKEVRKCNKTCSKIKTNYAKNKKKLKQQKECYGTCDKERLINIRKVHKQFSKEFKQFIKNM